MVLGSFPALNGGSLVCHAAGPGQKCCVVDQMSGQSDHISMHKSIWMNSNGIIGHWACCQAAGDRGCVVACACGYSGHWARYPSLVSDTIDGLPAFRLSQRNQTFQRLEWLAWIPTVAYANSLLSMPLSYCCREYQSAFDGPKWLKCIVIVVEERRRVGPWQNQPCVSPLPCGCETRPTQHRTTSHLSIFKISFYISVIADSHDSHILPNVFCLMLECWIRIMNAFIDLWLHFNNKWRIFRET